MADEGASLNLTAASQDFDASEKEDEFIAKDVPELVALLSDLNDKLSDANKRTTSLIEKVDTNTLSTEKGVSFLEMKFHLLLSYLINLVHYMLLKAHGKSIEGSPTVDRLVELRTVMEKIRPIDQKLKYQIDKLIKIATTGLAGQENDPLRFKPRPENLVSKLEETEEMDEGEAKKPGIYVPPKVAAMHYDDDKMSRCRKSEETARKKALSSSLLKELRDEYSEAPEELKEGEVFDKRNEKEIDEDKHQQRYEEENLVRLMSRKSGKNMRRQTQSLDDLTKFTDLSVLTKNIVGDESEDSEDGGTPRNTSKKKRKSRSFGKSNSNKKHKKGSFKRRQ
ncbi:neuroguidin-A-like [Dendronephthya gigantea]|uniref:neuroguidin-A-like n=1 Tax=Dendronephthya gigantea TaxID=151771 RepID=UPI00106CD790|nr:neuroguidin-A-like [Dendronephthya gigantea]